MKDVEQYNKNKGNDERKRQRSDSENDVFRKSFKTDIDEYVANPRISNNNISKINIIYFIYTLKK